VTKVATYGMAAVALAASVVLLHVFGSAWVAAWFPELQKPLTDPTPLSPWAKGVMLGYLALSVGGPIGAVFCLLAGISARDDQRWARERQEQQRLHEIRDQLWLESLPPEARDRVLAQRRDTRELEERARAILAAERRGEADGR
jgi:hypothetical protein